MAPDQTLAVGNTKYKEIIDNHMVSVAPLFAYVYKQTNFGTGFFVNYFRVYPACLMMLQRS
jgi:hypothetical protein